MFRRQCQYSCKLRHSAYTQAVGCDKFISIIRQIINRIKLEIQNGPSPVPQRLHTIVANERKLHNLQEQLEELNSYDLSDIFWIDISHQDIGRINGLRLSSQVLGQPSLFHTEFSWREINAGLGSVALLVQILQKRLGIRSKYEIECGASTSKIGKDGGALYNLYFESSFQFFAKRNFHTACLYLLESIHELGEFVKERDGSIVLPYEIEADKINQVSVYFWAPDNDWTRAMKYMLTNLKHLLVYCAGIS